MVVSLLFRLKHAEEGILFVSVEAEIGDAGKPGGMCYALML